MNNKAIIILDNYITLLNDLLYYNYNTKIKYQIRYLINQIKCFSLYIRKCICNNNTYIKYCSKINHFLDFIKHKYYSYLFSLFSSCSCINHIFRYDDKHDMNATDNYDILYKQIFLTNKL